MFVCFVVRGESPGSRLFATASMLEWLRNPLPHLSHGSSTERWSRNTVRVVAAIVFYIFLIIRWRWQRHLTWSATHDGPSTCGTEFNNNNNNNNERAL